MWAASFRSRWVQTTVFDEAGSREQDLFEFFCVLVYVQVEYLLRTPFLLGFVHINTSSFGSSHVHRLTYAPLVTKFRLDVFMFGSYFTPPIIYMWLRPSSFYLLSTPIYPPFATESMVVSARRVQWPHKPYQNDLSALFPTNNTPAPPVTEVF